MAFPGHNHFFTLFITIHWYFVLQKVRFHHSLAEPGVILF